MKLIPVLTEKSMSDAKEGIYTFWVENKLTKHQIKEIVNSTFGVHVVDVRTMTVAGETKKTWKGRKKVVKSRKKAVVTLKAKEKIDLFEEGKK